MYLNKYKGCNLQVKYFWRHPNLQINLFIFPNQYHSSLHCSQSGHVIFSATQITVKNRFNRLLELRCYDIGGLWGLRFWRQWWRFGLTCHVCSVWHLAATQGRISSDSLALKVRDYDPSKHCTTTCQSHSITLRRLDHSNMRDEAIQNSIQWWWGTYPVDKPAHGSPLQKLHCCHLEVFIWPPPDTYKLTHQLTNQSTYLPTQPPTYVPI